MASTGAAIAGEHPLIFADGRPYAAAHTNAVTTVSPTAAPGSSRTGSSSNPNHCQCVCCRAAARSVSSNSSDALSNPAGLAEPQPCTSSTAIWTAQAFAAVPASSITVVSSCDQAALAGPAAETAPAADAPPTATERAAAKAAAAAAADAVTGCRPKLHSFCSHSSSMSAAEAAKCYMQGCVEAPDAWARKYDCLAPWCSEPSVESLAAAECYVAGVEPLPLPCLDQCPEHAAAYQACKVLFEAKAAASVTLNRLQDCQQQLVCDLAVACVEVQSTRAAKAAAACSGNAIAAATTAAAAQAAAENMEIVFCKLQRVQGQLGVAVAALQQYEAAGEAAFAEVRSAQHALMKRLEQRHMAMMGTA